MADFQGKKKNTHQMCGGRCPGRSDPGRMGMIDRRFLAS